MNIRKILLFSSLACVPAWAMGFGFFASGGRLQTVTFTLMAVAYMFTPALAAVITHKLIGRQPLKALGFHSPRWTYLLAAWSIPFLLVWTALIVGTFLPGVSLSLGLDVIYEHLAGLLPTDQLAEVHGKLDGGFLARPGVLLAIVSVQVLVAGATVNALAAFGEELGWRGLLARELAPLGFWRSSLVTGIIWGLWHLPLILNGYTYPGHPLSGMALMIMLTVLLSPLLAFLQARGRSIIAPAIFHGTFNAAATLVIFVRGANPLLTGITGVVGLAVLALANFILWLRLSHEKRIAPDSECRAGV